MEITPQLIQRFLENRCSPEEFEAVTRWLESHPADAARMLGWEDVEAQQAVTDHDPAAVLARLRGRLFSRDEAASASKDVTAADGVLARHGARVRRLAWYAAAACMLLVVAGAGMWLRGRQGGAIADVVARPRAHWHEKRNSGDKPLIISLPDSSLVTLYGHSSLRYSDSFGLVRRESWVEGEADFVVRKDDAHPFTAFSGMLATTALGTSFGVKDGAEVKLYTGKVVVRYLSREVYLIPGQQLRYDSLRLTAAVSRFAPAPLTTTAGRPVEIKDLAFNNSPLREVFRRLSAHYHTTITYRAADVAGMNFTGTVNSQDSLSSILRLLATMNGLAVREAPAGFVVRKSGE